MSASAQIETKQPEPVLIAMSILGALQMFFAGGAGVSIIGDNDLITGIFAVGALAVGAAQFGVQFYVRGQVTANEAVVERLTTDGRVIAGPANDREREGATVREIGRKFLIENQGQGRLDGLDDA